MLAYSQPLLELQAQVSRFLRDRSLRLLHVVTDADLHDAAVDLVAGQELRLDNRSPFVVLLESHAKGDPGWDRRTYTARKQHERRRAEMAENGEALGVLPPVPSAKGLGGFGEQLGQLLLVRPEDTEGLVVVLAPAYVEAGDAWQQALGVLLSLPALAAVRFVVVDRGRSTISGLVTQHEGRALTCRCQVQGESPKAVLASALNEDLLRVSGPIGARPKGVIPPRRPGDPPAVAPDPGAVQQLEVSRNVLLASVAMDEGRVSDAIAHQRQARDASFNAERIEQGVMLELILGGYLSAARAGDEAEQSYQRAAATAEGAGLLDKAAVAHLALGSSRLTRRDRPGALVAYAWASTLAERAGQGALALQACQLTGNVARELRMDAQAIAFWAKALEIAERDPKTAPLTGAGLVALELARLCRERGQHQHVAQLLAKAEQLAGLDPGQLLEAPAPAPTPLPAAAPAAAPSAVSEAEPAEVPHVVRETAPGITVEPASVTLPLASPPERSAPAIEGTEQLTWAEIAALHWPTQSLVVVPEAQTEPAPPYHWSEAEQATLRAATSEIITEDTTALLSQAELRALRGEADLPPAQVPPAAESTLRVDPAELERLRRPVVVPELPKELPEVGDETEMLSVEMIRAMQAKWAARKAAREAAPQGAPEGEEES